jgi:predicted PurR-regulated permease PerM
MLKAKVDSSPELASEHTMRRVNAMLGLIVGGLIITFCFLADVLCITVLAASFLAILVDPVVVWLEKVYVRRPLAAALVVGCGVTLVGVAAYGAYLKTNNFANHLPAYTLRLREAIAPIVSKFESLQQNAESLAPHDGLPEIKIHETPNWPSFLVRGMGSITNGLIMAGVVPFLCFFMLTKKEQLSARFELVFDSRIDVSKFVKDLNGMIRGFVVGNLVVGSITAGAAAFVLFLLGIKNPIALGMAVALLNLIPFLGAPAAGVVAIAAGLLQFSTLWPFLGLILTILVLHVVSQNVLIPRIIGSRVSVGPVGIIVGMLFWGWLWGVPGLLLAVPLTAFLRLISATQPSLAHLSGLLAESPCPKKQKVPLEECPVHKVTTTYRSTVSESAVKS